MYRLIKKIRLARPEYDQFIHDIFGGYSQVERSLHDLSAVIFKLKYMFRYQQQDIQTKLEPLLSDLSEANVKMKTTWSSFLVKLIVDGIGFSDSEFSAADVEDVYLTNVNLTFRSVELDVGILSDSIDYLNYLDHRIPDDDEFQLYPTKFFRYHSQSYNESIESLYPELFEKGSRCDSDHDKSVFCHNVTIGSSDDCNLCCSYCAPAGSKILMADFTIKSIEDINIGDSVIGFNEHRDKLGEQRKLNPTNVTSLIKRSANDCIVISSPWMIKNLIVTKEHPILTSRGFVKAENLTSSSVIYSLNFNPEISLMEADTESEDYIVGYFLSAFMGDGCIIDRDACSDGYHRYFMRFIVKDFEMMERVKFYSKILDFDFMESPFTISQKYGIREMCIRTNKRSDFEKYHKFYMNNIGNTINESRNFLLGFLAGIYDAEGSFDGYTVRISNTDPLIFCIIEKGLKLLNIEYTYDGWTMGLNKPKNTIRIFGGASSQLVFFKSIKNAIMRKGINRIYGKSLYRSIIGVKCSELKETIDVYNLETESGTFILDSILVHNCYQFNKGNSRMSFDTGKQFIDDLLADKYGYVNSQNSPALILEFIGGDPLLEMHLTRKLYEYFLDRCWKLDHRWFNMHRLSICSNGMLYFEPDVQSFFEDFSEKISFNISIDGNKELHDSCRIQPNGEGSYDVDMVALKHFNTHHTEEKNSKMTLADANIMYLFDSVVNFINLGMYAINLNCVFEDVWSPETALIEYQQLKKLADHIIDNHLEKLYIAIFDDRPDERVDKHSDSNFCFRGDTQILTPQGERNIEDLQIGDLTITSIGSTHRVTRMSKRISDNNVKVTLNSTNVRNTFVCTADHKFFARRPITPREDLSDDSEFWTEPEFTQINQLQPLDQLGMPLLSVMTGYDSRDTWAGKPNMRWIDIKSIEPSPDACWVYCPMVMPLEGSDAPEEHTIIIHGIAAINCGGGSGSMLALSPNGTFYPCVRYMPASVGTEAPNVSLGTVDTGMIGRKQNSDVLKIFDSTTRRSQSNDICYDCPIGTGCAWCSALAVGTYGTNNKRPIFYCLQVIAEALANVYYWNSLLLRYPQYNLPVRKNNVPDQWARMIISDGELEELKLLECAAMISKLDDVGN